MRDDRHGRAGLDRLGDPAKLRAAAEAELAQLGIDRRPDAVQEGADGTDSVWVSVDAAGAVVDVSIGRTWSRELEPWQLGDAIFEAYRSARHKHEVAQLADRPWQAPAPSRPVVRTAPYPDDPRWSGWVWDTLDAASAQLDELARPAPRPSSSASPGTGRTGAGERDVRGPRRYARVRLSGDEVTGVLVDAPGFAVQAPDEVAQDVFAALRSVERGARR